MGFFSSLFGGGKESEPSDTLRKAFAQIQRLIEDDAYQLEMLPPQLQAAAKAGAIYDRDPNGTGQFGFAATNPIPVNGPIGELAYLSKLETNTGQRLLFHRLGSVNSIDVFEAVAIDGSEWFVLFVDMYHPRKSRIAPAGLRFAKGLAQFTGFNSYCGNFPYDFVERKEAQSGSMLNMAYIPVSKVLGHLESKAYERPSDHKAKVATVSGQLQSRA